MSEWRSVSDDPPDWPDGGDVCLKRKDGTIAYGRMLVGEVWTGEDEIPVVELVEIGGTPVDFWSFEWWRKVTK